jgi:hypothetical protein
MWIAFAVLSLDKYVNQAGTDVGFGCLLAVALLALLYFAGARETRSLRDQLDEAQNRIASLEARVTQALRQPAGGRAQGAGARAGVTQPPSLPSRPGVVPAPSVGVATSSGAVSRVPRDGALATSAAATVTGTLLGAPAGAGAPSLGSATKLIPSPQMAPVAAPSIGRATNVPVPATAAAVAAGSGIGAVEGYGELDDDEDEFEPGDTMFVPAAAGGGPSVGSQVAPAPARFFADEDAPAGPAPRRTIPTVETGPSRPRRFARALIGALIALVVAAAIVVGLLLATGNGNSTSTTGTAAQNTVTARKIRTPVFKPASVKVSVLNGTGQAGLAGDVAKLIAKSGYTVPAAAITNAAVQTDSTTTVAYRKGFRADALRVAKSLTTTSGVVVSQIVAADNTAITSCATPTATGQAGTCPAKVIVTVGTDLESAATGSSGA